MNSLVLFEDRYINNLVPFIYSRHSADIYLGGLTNIDRIKILASKLKLIDEVLIEGRGYLSEYVKGDLGLSSYDPEVDEEYIMVNSLICEPITTLMDIIKRLSASKNMALLSNGRLVGFNVSRDKADNILSLVKNDDPTRNFFIRNSIDVVNIDVNMVRYPWDILYNIRRLIIDESRFYTDLHDFKMRNVSKYSIFFKDFAFDEGVYLDTSNGPIIIEEGSEMQPFSIVRGPAWIKNKAQVLSAKVTGPVVIGRVSKIGSEIDYSVLDDYSNMAHIGFLGHSYVGRWVNVGAGTVFSDLKNTYGAVKMNVNGAVTSSGKIKLGSFASDFSKIAIGTMIYSGKWIGASSHVYDLVDRDVPSFTIWRNGLFKEVHLDKAIEIQARMFSRRDIIQKSYHRKILDYLFNITRDERERLIERNPVS